MKKVRISKSSLLSVIPILLFGISCLFEFMNVNMTVYYTSLIISISSMFLLFGLGWVKNFPEWTIHSFGFCTFISIYLTTITIPSVFGKNLLGIYGLLPIMITLLISLAINFSIEPLRQLYHKILNDKSLLIFIFYGFLPVLLMFQFDEIDNLILAPISIILTLMTASGVVIYLNSTMKNLRTISLISGIILTNSLAIATTLLL